MSEYGSDCVLTTDGGCLSNKDAEAVLELQAGLGSDYAMNVKRKPFYMQVNAIETHTVCARFIWTWQSRL